MSQDGERLAIQIVEDRCQTQKGRDVPAHVGSRGHRTDREHSQARRRAHSTPIAQAGGFTRLRSLPCILSAGGCYSTRGVEIAEIPTDVDRESPDGLRAGAPGPRNVVVASVTYEA